jgi:hypothetical protein
MDEHEVAFDGAGMADLPPIEAFLEELATAHHLPDLAVAMCTLRFPESAPALRAVLTRAADGEELGEHEATLLFRGLHVLGGRRDTDAFAPLLRVLRRPAEELDWLLGDLVTETLARIAAGVFDGNADALFEAIADRRLNEFIREALLGAAAFLTWDGRIERSAMVRLLERFHEEPLAEDEDYAWIGWLEAVALLGLRELAPLVERAWREGRIPDGVLERRHFAEDLARAEHAPDDIGRFEDANRGYIKDVIEALDWTRRGEEDQPDDTSQSSMAAEWTAANAPFVNPWRHVGRNDPCPCGSGKKAKRCCLGGGQNPAP